VQAITAGFIVGRLGGLSPGLAKPTVTVLAKARVHTAKQVKERLPYWQNRCPCVFYLPPCPPLEPGRKAVERAEGQVAETKGLPDNGHLVLCRSPCLDGRRKRLDDQLF